MKPRIPFQHIDAAAAEILLADPRTQCFDVRDAQAYAESHIPGACPLNSRSLDVAVATARKDHPVLIYCYRGVASLDYAQTFSDFGFSVVYSLDGGYEGWRKRARAKRVPGGDTILAAWLAEHGFPENGLDATIANRTTPLMKAAHRGERTILQALLAAGADLSARNADGNTALWFACVGAHFDIATDLIEAGADLDNRNDNGATVLMYAASSGKADLVRLLLAKGSALAIESLDGFTALDMASTVECLTLLRHADKAARAPGVAAAI